jgi:hypothetical protein
MWTFLDVLRVDEVAGGWRALLRMDNNGIVDTVLIPSPTEVLRIPPTDIELRILGEHAAIMRNAEAARPTGCHMTLSQFRSRFTLEERIVLDNIEQHPSLSDAQKARVRAHMTDILTADVPINPGSNVIADAVFYFEFVALLTHERALVILGLS